MPVKNHYNNINLLILLMFSFITEIIPIYIISINITQPGFIEMEAPFVFKSV